jgi:hypothetical protein
MPTVFGEVKLVGHYADRIVKEAREKKVSNPALITDYVMRGIDATDAAGDNELRRLDRRLSVSILALHNDVEAVQAELDALTALFDMFVKLMLLHLPEPVLDEAEAVRSSALTRYERFLKQVAESGFDEGRPVALRRIARLLKERIQVAEVVGE